MFQGVKVLQAKPGDLSLIPKSHMVEGENQPLQVVLRPSSCALVCMTHTHAHTHLKHF